MFTRSVDKAVAFPPPIKAITRYENVSHARIFGTHLFGVDYSEARRDLPRCLLGSLKQNSYTQGCPFYKEQQREFLLMPAGVRADVCGVLALAPQEGVCFVLAKNDSEFSGGQRVDFPQGEALRPTLQEAGVDKRVINLLIWQFEFCRGGVISAEQMFAGIGWFAKLPEGKKVENSQKLERYGIQLRSIVQGLRFDTVFQIS
jgi:hypothetical protein